MIIEVKNVQDRRALASILVESGYTVKMVKIKERNNVTKTYIEAEKEEEQK